MHAMSSSLTIIYRDGWFGIGRCTAIDGVFAYLNAPCCHWKKSQVLSVISTQHFPTRPRDLLSYISSVLCLKYDDFVHLM